MLTGGTGTGRSTTTLSSNISSIPVSYGQSDVLKMQVTFKIDRYVIGRSYSVDYNRNDDNNKLPSQPQLQPVSQPKPRLVPKSPGSIPSNGVELFPANQTLAESLYGSQNNR